MTLNGVMTAKTCYLSHSWASCFADSFFTMSFFDFCILYMSMLLTQTLCSCPFNGIRSVNSFPTKLRCCLPQIIAIHVTLLKLCRKYFWSLFHGPLFFWTHCICVGMFPDDGRHVCETVTVCSSVIQEAQKWSPISFEKVKNHLVWRALEVVVYSLMLNILSCTVWVLWLL